MCYHACSLLCYAWNVKKASTSGTSAQTEKLHVSWLFLMYKLLASHVLIDNQHWQQQQYTYNGSFLPHVITPYLKRAGRTPPPHCFSQETKAPPCMVFVVACMHGDILCQNKINCYYVHNAYACILLYWSPKKKWFQGWISVSFLLGNVNLLSGIMESIFTYKLQLLMSCICSLSIILI